jgi:eukaryotic-like serine/threonine-protein kinase
MKKDRSLLFGLLAVSMNKVRPDKLSEVARRTQTNSQAELGKSLVDEGLLTDADREQLDSLVEMSLAEHEGDASATIQALGKEPDKLASVVDSMDDFVAAFEKSSEIGADSLDDGSGPADSILGDFSEADSLVGDAPPPDSMSSDVPNLDSLLVDDDPARTRLTQSGNTGDKGSVGDIVGHDAPDSFFESIGSTGTHIMSPVQAAAEIDESEIVPAVAEHDGRYETVREFAKGGMGQITLVHDTHLGRDVALKQLLQQHILPGTQAGAPTTAILTIPIIARFLQEARITGQLEHPSIIPVYELGYRDDGSLYYTMKLIRGQSMHDFLKEAKTLNDRLPLLTHFLDLCQAISYAHSRGVIHRDLKPMNLMIGEFGETVVIDWGIAKVRGEDDIHAKGLEATVTAMRVSSAEATAKTMYGQTIGSPYFMPAEQAMGRTDLIDERSDIYSLGAVLYTVLTGKMPYAGNNVREFMEKVGHVEPKPVRMLEPDVKPELEAICSKAMALVPENRYQSAKELTDEIQNYLSGGMVDAYSYNLGELIKRFYKKHKKVLTTAAMFTVLLLGSGIFYTVNLYFARQAEAEAKDEAIRQKGIAVEQEQIAQEERENAESERDNAQQQLYYANIANTYFNVSDQQIDKARELLANCLPERLRQWEWGYFGAVTHADTMTLERGGKFTAFTDNGEGLLVGTKRGSLSLHNLRTGEMVHEFVHRGGTGAAIASSADGSRVALRSEVAVQVWEVATQKELFLFDEPKGKPGEGQRLFLDMSADGKYVAALNSDRTTRVWDVDAGRVAFTVEDCVTAKGFGLYFSPDGSRLLVVRQVFGDEGMERRFQVFGIPTGEMIKNALLPKESVLSIHTASFSPNNNLLAFGMDDRLALWDIETGDWRGNALTRITFLNPDVVRFSPDGAYVAAGEMEGGLLLCDSNGKLLKAISKAHEGAIHALRFSNDGSRVATVSDDRTVRLWSVPDLLPLKTYRGHIHNVFTAAFSQDDLSLATSGFDGTSKIWDLSADLDFAPVELPGFKLATYNPTGDVFAGTTQKHIVLWRGRTGHRLHNLESHDQPAKALALNVSGTLVASIGQQGDGESLRIWDIDSGELLENLPTGLRGSVEIAFAMNDERLLIGAGRNVVQFNREDKSFTPLLRDALVNELDKAITPSFRASPDQTQVAICLKKENGPFQAVLRNLADGAEVASVDIDGLTDLRAFFTPTEGTLVLSQEERSKTSSGIDRASVSLWDTNTGSISEPVHSYAGGAKVHQIRITSLAISPDGNALATGDRQGRVALWAYDGKSISSPIALRGHTGMIQDIAFSPDGNRMVTGSDDRSFKIWEVETGSLITTLQEAAVLADVDIARPTQVAFSADGLRLATITEPPVSPMILHAFSTDMADYPEATLTEEEAENAEDEALAVLEKRMEAYKRQYWAE